MQNAQTSPEYVLARRLIAHLREDEALRECVLPEPWDSDAQVGSLLLAARMHDMALAVTPQPPAYVAGETPTTGGLRARLAVVVLTTRQVGGGNGERLAAKVGRTIARCLHWADDANGIPYAEAEMEGVEEIDVSSYPAFEQANLMGSVIALSRHINYRKFYS